MRCKFTSEKELGRREKREEIHHLGQDSAFVKVQAGVKAIR
jgi:hypothetical protein